MQPTTVAITDEHYEQATELEQKQSGPWFRRRALSCLFLAVLVLLAAPIQPGVALFVWVAGGALICVYDRRTREEKRKLNAYLLANGCDPRDYSY